MGRRRQRTIEGDTILMPAVVSDAVVMEVARGLYEKRSELTEKAKAFVDDAGLQRAMSDALVAKADEAYRTDARFAKAMHADAGRDVLWSWMRKAAAEAVLKDLGAEAHEALPAGLAQGDDPESPPTPGM